jgi:HAMP domain-containing protein
VEAVTWTALAILGAFSLGVLALQVGQNSRIDSVRDRMDQGFREIRQEMDQGFREVRDEIRALSGRIEQVERRIEGHEARHGH